MLDALSINLTAKISISPPFTTIRNEKVFMSGNLAIILFMILVIEDILSAYFVRTFG